MYTIYKHTNKSSGKVYIGITGMNPKRRWSNGLCYKSCTLFNRAIEKYGWSEFNHEILEEGLTKEEAQLKEVKLIALYDSTNPEKGYNITIGGESANGLRNDNLSIAMKKYWDEHPERRAKPKEKKDIQRPTISVDVYDKELNFLGEYKSLKDAAEKYCVHRSHVSNCINHKRGSTGEYIFVRHGETPVKPNTVYKGRPRKRTLPILT